MRLISVLAFLLCCSIAFADVVGLVGGSSADPSNACFLDPGQATVVDAHNGNGANLFTDIGVTMREGGSGFVQIDIPDGVASSDWIGVYVNFTNSNGSEAAGRNRIAVVDISGDPDTIDIYPLEWIDGTSCNIVVGGAVPIVDGTYELQDVLDDTTIGSAAAQDVDILIAGSDTATGKILLDVGGGALTGTFKRLIGTNTSYVDDGTLAVITIDTANMGPGSPLFQVDDISSVIFKNIHVNITGDAATAGEDCFQIANGTAQVAINFYNCKATNGYRGFNYDGDAVNRMSWYELVDCMSTGSVAEGMRLVGTYFTLDRCYIEASSTYAVFARLPQGTISNCICDGGETGIWYDSSGPWGKVVNCSFYNQTTSCIGANALRDVGISVYNNLFWVADINADFPILNTSGVIYLSDADWNFTNADATRSSMLTGANSQNTLWSDTETNLWTDAANDDFTVVDAGMIDGGMPTLSDEGGTPVDGYTTAGAAQLKQTQTGGNVVIIRRQ